ncbi:hypothetical protein G7046_g5179 [Stylonectria norvegica]|nr:hypothetical protein G7046_g5179 [Stylonectria norvegica]
MGSFDEKAPGPHDRRSTNTLSSTETQAPVDFNNRRLSKAEEKETESSTKPELTDALPAAEPAVEAPAPNRPAYDDEAAKNYKPKTIKFWLVMMSAIVSMFLVALDRTIISTAIPEITNEFDSVGDIGWYASAYMLTSAAFQLVFGRIYRFYDLKWTILTCIGIFTVGSTICGAAPNSNAFIVGRAIAGIGSSGITTGSIMTIMPMVPLHKRPMFMAMFGMVFGIASVAGPLIGGALTENATWRWCFYMNLPIAALAFGFLLLFLHPAVKEQKSVSITEHIKRLDPLGTFFFVPSMVCLILALQWGGSKYEWSNWRLIVLFVMFGLTFIAFGIVQVMMPETATLPVRVMKQRMMLVAVGYMFLLAGAMMLAIYYVPLWFQAVKGVSPIKSGVYTIPLVLSITLSSAMSAAFTQRVGYFAPAMILCPCIMAVGEGLLSTFHPNTGSSHWIAFQFLTGYGLGFGMQTVNLGVQATLPKEDIPTGIATTFWAQQLGGAVFVPVGQTILSSCLVSRLSDIPGLDPQVILNTGATNLHTVVPSQYMGQVVSTYNYACTRIFLCAVGLSCAQLLCALCVKWISIKKGKGGPPGPPGQGPKTEAAGDKSLAEEK